MNMNDQVGVCTCGVNVKDIWENMQRMHYDLHGG